MPNYLLAYHGGGGMAGTKAEQDKVMAAPISPIHLPQAAMVDAGNPIGGTSTIASNGSVSTGGGANPLTGYSVITANDMASAGDGEGLPRIDGGRQHRGLRDV